MTLYLRTLLRNDMKQSFFLFEQCQTRCAFPRSNMRAVCSCTRRTPRVSPVSYATLFSLASIIRRWKVHTICLRIFGLSLLGLQSLTSNYIDWQEIGELSIPHGVLEILSESRPFDSHKHTFSLKMSWARESRQLRGKQEYLNDPPLPRTIVLL